MRIYVSVVVYCDFNICMLFVEVKYNVQDAFFPISFTVFTVETKLSGE